MAVLVNYQVDRGIYDNPGAAHEITLITTEYTYKNDMLVHLQMGKNLNIKLNNLLQYKFNKDKNFHNEQFLFKKIYNKGDPKPTTRSTFEEKIKQFNESQTKISREILEEYRYTGKNGKSAAVQIAVTEKDESMRAVIDFKDAEQYENFIEPAWLTQIT